jgi:hypothetical protein
MQSTLLDPARIERDWPSLSERLWPAVRQDPTYNLAGLYQRLINGSACLFEVNDGASGLWVISLAEEGDNLIAWTTAIAGRIDGGPKRRLAEMRHALRALERTLKIAGVKAHRMCGRDYSRLFPDYQPYAGARNGLQKEL